MQKCLVYIVYIIMAASVSHRVHYFLQGTVEGVSATAFREKMGIVKSKDTDE